MEVIPNNISCKNFKSMTANFGLCYNAIQWQDHMGGKFSYKWWMIIYETTDSFI